MFCGPAMVARRETLFPVSYMGGYILRIERLGSRGGMDYVLFQYIRSLDSRLAVQNSLEKG